MGWMVLNIEELPVEFKYAMGPLIVLIFFLLFCKAYTKEVIIGRQFIELKIERFFSENINTIVVNDVEHISLREMHGRGGGYFYKLQRKDGSKITFFTIPVLFMKPSKTKKINEVLSGITALEVKKV